jgi:small subunit ribosomal protein S1
VSSRRHIGRVAAAEEQETAYQQPEGEQPQVTAAAPIDQADGRQYELEELDAAQEDLLKWMLYLDKEEQQEDLDEMVDYSEFGDGEYEDIMEDVEEMMEQANYSFKPGDKIVGTVYEVDEDGAYVEIGAKSAGFVPLSECSLAKLKSVGICTWPAQSPD